MHFIENFKGFHVSVYHFKSRFLKQVHPAQTGLSKIQMWCIKKYIF